MRAATLLPPEPDAWGDRRVVVVVAHPDDEVLGCGALIAALQDVRIVHVTDGAPRQGTDAARHGYESATDYAAGRHAEALAALALADVAPARLLCLGFADQSASEHLVEIARSLIPLIAQADIVLTHAYEGGHCDHDAVAFAVHAARVLGCAGSAFDLVEMPFYYADRAGWIRQRFLPEVRSYPSASLAPDARCRIPVDERTELQGVGSEADRHMALGIRSGIPECVLALTPARQALKSLMVAAHVTQAETLASFALDAERFRYAPPYDFTARPHDGPLLYERHGWNLTWPLWKSRVVAAAAALCLPIA